MWRLWPRTSTPERPESGRPASRVARILLVVVLVVAIAAGWALLGSGVLSPGVAPAGSSPSTIGPPAPVAAGSDIDELQVGQCLQFVVVADVTPDPVDGAVPMRHRVVDCSLTGGFLMIVASLAEGPAICPGADLVQYFQRGTLGEAVRTVCLAPVFEVGACYAPAGVLEWAPVACTDPAAHFRVLSDVPGTGDVAACPDPENVFVLPGPPPGRVYCLVAPQ